MLDSFLTSKELEVILNFGTISLGLRKGYRLFITDPDYPDIPCLHCSIDIVSVTSSTRFDRETFIRVVRDLETKGYPIYFEKTLSPELRDSLCSIGYVENILPSDSMLPDLYKLGNVTRSWPHINKHCIKPPRTGFMGIVDYLFDGMF